MKQTAWTLACFIVVAAHAEGADDRDPLAAARLFYNQRDFVAAVAAADQARLVPARADSADLIAARAFLEQYRESSTASDLVQARERLRRITPDKFVVRERIEFLVGLGETLYFEGSFGAAADVFDSVLRQSGALKGEERDRVLDWWATALDRDARPHADIDRQAIYQRIRDGMHVELGTTPASVTAMYWLAAAARGQGDLQGAWDAALAGWVRAPLAGLRGAALREDLDQLVVTALVPERARALGQPPNNIRQEWDRFRERWSSDTP